MVVTRLEAAFQSVASNYSPEYLKSSINAELDKLGDGDQRADEERLLKILCDWSRDRSSTLPSFLLYPVVVDSSGVENDAYCGEEKDGDGLSPGLSFLQAVEGEVHDGPNQAVGIKNLNKRGRAMAVLLRNLSRDGEFEVFLTQPSGSPSSQEEERQLYGASSRNYMDVTGRLIFKNFRLDIENNPGSTQSECGLALTIVPWRRLLIDLMSRTAEDDPRSDIMCYLLHHAVDRGSFDLTFCCNEYGALLGNDWPRSAEVLERWLLSSVFFTYFEDFNLQAMSYHGEPPPRFFHQLSSAFKFTGQTEVMERYGDGLDFLLENVSHENTVDALCQLEDPENVANNLLGYVAKFIDDYIYEINEGDEEVILDIEEAQVIVGICARFQKAFNMAEQ